LSVEVLLSCNIMFVVVGVVVVIGVVVVVVVAGNELIRSDTACDGRDDCVCSYTRFRMC